MQISQLITHITRTLPELRQVTAAATTGPFCIKHGQTPGNIVGITAPKMMIGNPKYSDSDGVAMIDMDLTFIPYIRNIGPLLDENKQPVEFTDAIKDMLLKQPWLQQPIGDGFAAVQRGLTAADYRKLRAKNS